MASSVAAITAIVNLYLKRAALDTRPWTDAQITQCITDTLDQLWPDIGYNVYGEVTTDGQQFITVPTELTANGVGFRISRIILKNSSGTSVDKVTGWQPHINNQIFVKTIIAAGNTMGFYGWAPFLNDATNLLARLNSVIALRATSFAWGLLGAELTNSEVQQNIDTGRVVTKQDALAQSAYFERRYQDAISHEPNRITVAPRASSRGR